MNKLPIRTIFHFITWTEHFFVVLKSKETKLNKYFRRLLFSLLRNIYLLEEKRSRTSCDLLQQQNKRKKRSRDEKPNHNLFIRVYIKIHQFPMEFFMPFIFLLYLNLSLSLSLSISSRNIHSNFQFHMRRNSWVVLKELKPETNFLLLNNLKALFFSFCFCFDLTRLMRETARERDGHTRAGVYGAIKNRLLARNFTRTPI